MNMQTITISQGNKGVIGTMDKADNRNSPEGTVCQRHVRRASQRKRYLSGILKDEISLKQEKNTVTKASKYEGHRAFLELKALPFTWKFGSEKGSNGRVRKSLLCQGKKNGGQSFEPSK